MTFSPRYQAEHRGSTLGDTDPSPLDIRRRSLDGAPPAPAKAETPAPPPSAPASEDEAKPAHQKEAGPFSPRKPTTLDEAGLAPDLVEQIVSRFLLTRGAATGRKLASQLGLPFRVIEPILSNLKNEMQVAYRRTAAAGDYEYVLTDAGSDRARRMMEVCTYAETAPVPLEDYVSSTAVQSLGRHRITAQHLHEAFFDLMMEEFVFDRLGPAITAGRGMFLYGAPGNGKTSVAERIMRCFGSSIWIPRAILIDGHILRLYDPILHHEISGEDSPLAGEPLEDARWVRIQRPTVVVGGELTMEQLEIRHDVHSNVSEAPLQMKSNSGALVIDDFGRQRMPVAELLNRWIVPLEKRYDFQKLPSGKKIQTPFEQFVIFSTNLEPRDLVDEAFLRRIPYKIEMPDPSPEQFRRICASVAPTLGFPVDEARIDAMIEKHYVQAKRPMRACHPRDLLLQARNFCLYRMRPVEISEEAIDFAVDSYFAVM